MRRSGLRPLDGPFVAAVGALLALLLATWWNHFGNGFHFDDFHTVTDNPAIRSLANIPRFFTDGRTFSVLPDNQGWRPLVSTTIAVDYYLAGGTERLFWFHLGTFLAFVATLACMYVMFADILDRARPDGDNRWIALFGVALFGVHPVSAETVNYVIQRADLYVALGFVASFAMYGALPSLRGYGLWLLPFLVASMAKPTALVFPLVLGVWLLLFGEGRRLLPFVVALVAAGGMALVHKVMTPPTYTFGGADPFGYRITQPFVALHTVRSLFLPTALSADSDWAPYTSLSEPPVIAGFLFVAGLIALAVWTSRSRVLRPVAFGLWWFLITFLPTALAPLAEVTNDHRMLLPMVGLMLAVTWGVALLAERWSASRWVAGLGVLVLLVFAWGTHQRNAVWFDERTLWADVVAKSPRNGRGWMNYGLTFMRAGQYDRALECFTEAQKYTPSYGHLEINLGVVNGAVGKDADAERHFQRAIQLDGRSGRPQFYFGRFLWGRKRTLEAITQLRAAIQANPRDIPARDLLMEVYHAQHNWTALAELIDDTRKVTPDDTTVNAFETMMKNERGADLASAEKAVREHPSPEAYLQLSLVYHTSGRFEDAIKAAQGALKLRPDYAEAWCNISAANLGLKSWDAAIAAADKAITLKPDFQLARNNKAYAEAQKKGK